MNKRTLCLAAVSLACAHAAQAQSSVVVFGVMDLNVQRMSSSGVGTTWQVGHSGLTNSRLGFRGTEDLGGGLKAGFWLEGGLNPDVGTGRPTNTNNLPSGVVPAGGLVFDRKSYVSLAGAWGEMRVGRDFVPTQYTNIEYDAFNTTGVARVGNLTYAGAGAGPLPTTIVASNSVSYWTPPSLGGFYGMALAAVAEPPANVARDEGRLYSVRAGYAAGPFNGAAAFSRTRYTPATAIGNYSHASVGAKWDAKFVRLYTLYSSARVELSAGEVRKDVWSVGAQVPLGASGTVRMSYARLDDRSVTTLLNTNGSPRQDNDATQYGVGYVHVLSKRTAIYGSYARLSNTGRGTYVVAGGTAPVAGGRSTGAEVGLRHLF